MKLNSSVSVFQDWIRTVDISRGSSCERPNTLVACLTRFSWIFGKVVQNLFNLIQHKLLHFNIPVCPWVDADGSFAQTLFAWSQELELDCHNSHDSDDFVSRFWKRRFCKWGSVAKTPGCHHDCVVLGWADNSHWKTSKVNKIQHLCGDVLQGMNFPLNCPIEPTLELFPRSWRHSSFSSFGMHFSSLLLASDST